MQIKREASVWVPPFIIYCGDDYLITTLRPSLI